MAGQSISGVDVSEDDEINWSYPRTSLAKRAMSILSSTGGQSLVIFGPRRIGKTWFLTRDLGPLAEARGHKAVYASLWQRTEDPLAVLIHALGTALHEPVFDRRVALSARGLFRSFKLKLTTSGVEAAIDPAAVTSRKLDENLSLLGMLLDELALLKKKSLLLLDEFQLFAKIDDAESFLKSFRTMLDTRKDGISVVFTGSSRPGLRAIFETRTAAFYRFGTSFPLPDLEDGFVEHMLRCFERASGRAIDRAEALKVFAEVERNPASFRELIDRMILAGKSDIAAAWADELDHWSESRGYLGVWRGRDLRPLDRAMARRLADGDEQPYSENTRLWIAKLLEIDPKEITRGKVQAALRKLEKMEIAEQWDGPWVLADPNFGRWMRQRPVEEITRSR